MKFTGDSVTNLLLLVAAMGIAFFGYEMVTLFNSILVIGEWG